MSLVVMTMSSQIRSQRKYATAAGSGRYTERAAL